MGGMKPAASGVVQNLKHMEMFLQFLLPGRMLLVVVIGLRTRGWMLSHAAVLLTAVRDCRFNLTFPHFTSSNRPIAYGQFHKYLSGDNSALDKSHKDKS